MEEFDYLIVGGGLAAASAVDGIRERDVSGTILLVSEEEEPPYHRPPLSKDYLKAPEAGRDMLHVKPEGWYEDEALASVRLSTRVTALDARERVVTTEEDDRLRGDRILLATGGRPRSLDVPGSDLVGVHTLRSVLDSEALREAAGEAERVVLVGAGFIGMELAASFRSYGIEPTVVESLDRVWAGMLTPELSGAVRRYYEERGVRFRLGTSVREFEGDARLRGVVLADGTRLPADFAVIGIGILPEVELAADAGLAVQDGIVVDEYAETSHPHIYAAGDVARFPDAVFGDTSRVEHWDHAKAHGKLAGRNMAGDRKAYDHLSYFFSDAFELGFNVLGRPGRVLESRTHGSLEEERLILVGADEDGLCAAILINASEDLEACRDLVRRRVSLEEAESKLEGDVEAGVSGP